MERPNAQGYLGSRIPVSLSSEDPVTFDNRISLLDDDKEYFGIDDDFSLLYDSANNALRIRDETSDTNILDATAGGTVRFNATNGESIYFSAADFRFYDQVDVRGNRIYHVGWMDLSAQDSAPTAVTGRVVLASPLWDPDGDGNGEIVCYDGGAWQEVVDLPNYT